MTMLLIVAITTLLRFSTAVNDIHPLTDEFINLINKKQTLWKAGHNFPKNTQLQHIKKLMGVLPGKNEVNLPTMSHVSELIISLPDNFDPRQKWPHCPSLNEIRDQGSCGSCWAFGAVESMTDRVCIFSNGTEQFHFSANNLISCCKDCGDGCEGGYPVEAWNYYKTVGIVSGGEYNSNEGCRPYEIPPCEHHTDGDRNPCDGELPTPPCVKSCQPNYNTPYEKDKRYATNVYKIEEEDNIKAELFKNGPIETSVAIYADFPSYKAGVYKHVQGELLGYHAVKMLGWGVENGVNYWLCANSWNTDWGDKGYFKILRGENHCGIESSLVTGEPLLTKNKTQFNSR